MGRCRSGGVSGRSFNCGLGKKEKVMKAPFRSINFVDTGSSPARINRKTRDLYLNKNTWWSLEPGVRLFILLHEYAHHALDSSDEEAVDALAFEWYVKLGYPLTESVKALSSILSDSESHVNRTNLQYDRAKKIDQQNSINESVKNNYMCASKTLFDSMDGFDGFVAFDDYSGCQPNEKPRDCRKRIRVEGNAQRKINRSEGFRLKREAKATLAEQGIAEPGFGAQFGSALKGVGGVVKDVLGRGGDGGGAAEPPKDNKMLYIGLAVGGLLLVGIVAVFAFKKK